VQVERGLGDRWAPGQHESLLDISSEITGSTSGEDVPFTLEAEACNSSSQDPAVPNIAARRRQV
jgi:hypothetical protein